MPKRSTTRWSSTFRQTRSRPTKPGPTWGKKDKNCDASDPADRERGSYWDHVILDVESRLIVSIVVGRRTAETLQQAFTDFYQRTDGERLLERHGRSAADDDTHDQ